MNELIKIDSCILILDDKYFTKLLPCGDGIYDTKTYKSILIASVNLTYLHFDLHLNYIYSVSILSFLLLLTILFAGTFVTLGYICSSVFSNQN